MTRLLTVGSVVLAIVNIGVMWAMAHHWRYAWHSNLGLQLLWLPYDTLTRQYGLLALGTVLACVSLKACFHVTVVKGTRAPRSQPQHRRPRRRASRHRHAVLGESPGRARVRDERRERRAAARCLRRVAILAGHRHQDRPAPELVPEAARELAPVAARELAPVAAEELAERHPGTRPVPVPAHCGDDREPAMADPRSGDA